MNIYTIYKITNKINDKNYIGFTHLSPEERLLGHFYEAKLKRQNRLLHNSIRKYGEENFSVEVLYQSYDKEHTLDEMETHFINEYDTFLGEGYNMTRGGEGGAGAPKGRPAPNKGMPAWNRGIPMTDEAKAKASASLKGQIAWNKGIPHSAETKLKQSKATKGIPKPTVTCPHCNKSGGKPAMIRHHFDRCSMR